MEEYGGRSEELRKMQREQERERRRIRDRERRQSMTQEQRERHLARRRRNYQLRRQRAASNNNNNSNNNITCFPLQAEAATTSHGHPSIVSGFISDYRVFQTESVKESSHYIDGVYMEALTYKPTNLPRRLRLNHIRQLARNLMHSIADHDPQIHQIFPHLIPNEEISCQGNIRKSLRRVKQLARQLNSPSKEISAQRQNGKVQQTINITFQQGTTFGDGFKCS